MAAATNGGRPSTSSRTSSRDGLWPGTRTKNSTTAPLVPFRRLGTTSTAPTNCSHSTPQRWAFSTRWSNASLTGSIPDRSGWGPPRFTDDSVRAVAGEEFCDGSSELAGVLKQKSVRSLRVDFDQRLGNETGQQIGKVRQDRRVAVTRGDEHRMTDRADSLQRCVIRDAPVAHRVILCLPGRPGGRFIDIVGASEHSAQCRLARLPTRRRRGEKDVEITLRVRLRLAHRIDYLGGPAVHAGPASWRGGGQHNSAHHIGPDKCDLLGNEAADREPEDIDAWNIQCGDESNGIAGHLLDCVGSVSGRGPDARIVERYDAPLSGQGVDQGRVPILQIAAEVLQQYQRDCAGADFTVGVGDAVVSVNDLIGSCAVADFCRGGHVAILRKYLVSQDDGLRGPEDTISSERSA